MGFERKEVHKSFKKVHLSIFLFLLTDLYIDMNEKGRPRGLILIGLPIVFSITYAYAKDKFNDASYFSAGWSATVGQ